MNLIIALFVLLSSASLIEAVQSLRNPPTGRRLDKDLRGRECALLQSSDEVEFECKSKTEDGSGNEIEDEIKFKIRNRDSRGIVVKVEYEQEVEANEQETETETSYEVVFDRIVEYKKGAGSVEDAYDWENDVVLQTMSLANLGSFSPVVETPTSSVFSVGSSDGRVTFTFTIHRASDGESINSNKMKIDFLLEDFPWIDSDSYVALISEVESEREVEVEFEGRKEKLSDVVIDFAEAVEGINGVIPFGSYTWEKTATVNATDMESSSISVVATSPKGPNPDSDDSATDEQWIAFSFVGQAAKSASSIYWDPEAGIDYLNRRTRTRKLVLGLSIGVAVLVVAAVAVWMVRYKGCKKMRSLLSSKK